MIDWTAIAAVIGSITTVTGTLGGYMLAGRNDEARDKRAAQRETAARRTALADRLEEERHTFQRDTLLELQDQLLQLVRNQSLVISQDIKTLQEHGQLFQLPEGLGGDEPRQTVVSLQRLRTRVLDPGLRQAIGSFIQLCTRDSTDLIDTEPEAAIRELRRRDAKVGGGYVELAELLGEHLRKELDRRILVNELEPVPPDTK